MLFFLLLSVTACSLTDAFVDRRREAGRTGNALYVGSSKTDAPVVCYNKLTTDFAKVQQMADEECVRHNTGVRAEFDEEDVFSCRILTPAKAKFHCVR